MFTVFVTFAVRPERVEEFAAALHHNARASLRGEPGCLRFDVHRSVERNNEFLVYEIYADEDAFYVSHRGAPHYAAWSEVVARCVPEGGHVNAFGTPAFPEDIPEAVAMQSGG